MSPESDLEAARRALARDPQSAFAWYNLGRLLANDTARAGEAETAYRKAIQLDPDNPRFIYRLGMLLYEQLQPPAEAEKLFRRAIELAPDEPFYYGGLVSMLVGQSRRAEALPIAQRMRALLNAAAHWYGLATLDSNLGNVDAAIESLRKAARAESFDREWARIDPDLASIRADPRFGEIVGTS